jgi:hypothetical protein
MLSERTVVATNSLYGKSERRSDVYSVMLKRHVSDNAVNSAMHFFKKNKKKMKQKDCRRENDTPC